MAVERTPQCVLGNGECPRSCELYEKSAKITNALGDSFDPKESRLNTIFADAFSPKVNVFDIARVMGTCAKEGKATKDISPKK